MKTWNVRRRQWRKYLEFMLQHPSCENMVVSPGMLKAYNREVARFNRSSISRRQNNDSEA